MKQFCAVALLLGTLAGLPALEWPVSTVSPVRFFGQRIEGVLERGLTLGNVDIVRSAGHGKLLITLASNGNMSGFPGTLGNAAVIAHDDGLLTVYGNLDALDRIIDRKEIETGDILANAGKSGWGQSGSCTFQVLDSVRHTVLNPLMLLPNLHDTHGPIIKNVVVVSPAGTQIPLGTAKFIRQGTWRLYTEVADTIDGYPQELGPFRISVLVNGTENLVLPFELLKENGGRLYLDETGRAPTSGIYEDPARMYLGEITLNRGRADISIIARDFAGNERSVQFGLQIE